MNGGTKPTITGMWCWFNHWIDRLTNQERKSCRFWSYLLFRQTHLVNLETLGWIYQASFIGYWSSGFLPKNVNGPFFGQIYTPQLPKFKSSNVELPNSWFPLFVSWSYFGWFSPHFLLLKSRCWLVQSHSVLLKFQRFGWINPHLVGGLENEIYDFPYFIIPTDSYFSEGVETTNPSFLLETTTLFHL